MKNSFLKILLLALVLHGCSTMDAPSPSSHDFEGHSLGSKAPSGKVSSREIEVVQIGSIGENGEVLSANDVQGELHGDGVVNISMGFGEEEVGIKEKEFLSTGDNNSSLREKEGFSSPASSDISTVVNPPKKKIHKKRIKFPSSEYEKLSSSGKGVIRGRVFLDVKGSFIPRKQVRLYLNPKTSYSDQWYDMTYLKGIPLGKVDKRLYRYLKFTLSNKNGDFAFFGVPDGDYYVIANIKCGKECGYTHSRAFSVAKAVTLKNGHKVTLDVDLSIVVQ